LPWNLLRKLVKKKSQGICWGICFCQEICDAICQEFCRENLPDKICRKKMRNLPPARNLLGNLPANLQGLPRNLLGNLLVNLRGKYASENCWEIAGKMPYLSFK